MPHVTVRLEAAAANFCDEMPSTENIRFYKRDPRIYFAFGFHPKNAKYSNEGKLQAVKKLILKEERCVAIGEIGIERTGGHSVKALIEYQTKVLKNMLEFYCSNKLWSKVLVIHSRDFNDSTDAQALCLAIIKNVLKDDLAHAKIHRHCFNGSVREMEQWQSTFPKVKFGFTGLLLRPERHGELDTVVEKLPLDQILLETDSPHLIAPEHEGCRFNTPYGAAAVAQRIADLKNIPVREVVRTTTATARRFYCLR